MEMELKQEQKVKCEQCGKQYSSKQSLTKHREAIHCNIRYDCTTCDYSTTYRSTLNTHIKAKHKGIKQACDLCDFTCNFSSGLYHHKKAKHEGVKYPCGRVGCDFKSENKASTEKHIEIKHVSVLHRCENCSYTTLCSSYMKRHKRLNHEGRKYSCDQCKFEVATKDNLKFHKITKHEGLKYTCDECGYEANWPPNLIAHHKKTQHEGRTAKEQTWEHILKHHTKSEIKHEAEVSVDGDFKIVPHPEEKAEINCYSAQGYESNQEEIVKKEDITGSYKEELYVSHICDSCNYTAANARGLSRHKKVVHQALDRMAKLRSVNESLS